MPVPGKQQWEGATQVNQRPILLDSSTAPNLVDMGRRSASRAAPDGATTRRAGNPSADETSRETALPAEQSCRSKAGHHSHHEDHGERGKRRFGAHSLREQDGQDQRRLLPERRGGGPVLVRGRESRPHGEGDQ